MVTRAGLVSYERANAVAGWAVVAVLLLVAVQRVASDDLLWAGMAAAVIAVALVPPVLSGHPEEMIAAEVLVLAALPSVAHAFDLAVGSGTYLAIAALALVVAVELDAFTQVEMTPDFAVAFVVVVTMAVAGLWAIAQFVSDAYLGTSLLTNQTALMWDLIGATVVGLVAGLVFELYFRRISPGHGLSREPWGEL
jgi:hypothetical protein